MRENNKDLTKAQIISAIDKALKNYSKWMLIMSKAGIDFSDVTEMSDLQYTLEDCSAFIKDHC